MVFDKDRQDLKNRISYLEKQNEELREDVDELIDAVFDLINSVKNLIEYYRNRKSGEEYEQ